MGVYYFKWRLCGANMINFQGGESPNVFYNTFFINFDINIFSPILWLSVLEYCLNTHHKDIVVSNGSLPLYATIRIIGAGVSLLRY